MDLNQELVERTSSELRVLLVEPDEGARDLLELALSARGHSVVTGSTASDALVAVADASFALIVADCSLPDRDTLDLCRELRDMEHGGAARLVLLTERCPGFDRDAALAAGADDCLAWPADALALRAHLEAIERGPAVADDGPAENGFEAPDVESAGPAAVGADVIIVPLRDQLTGLVSQALFIDRLEHALQLAQRRRQPVAAMMIDLEGAAEFDTEPGDGASIALQMAERLRGGLRPGDTATRLGSNAYGVLCEDVLDVDDALVLARAVIAEMHAPFSVAGDARAFTPRIGVAVSWCGSGTVEDVLNDAAAALQAAADLVQSDGQYAFRELGEQPIAAEPPAAPQNAPVPVFFNPADADELWYLPLMDRIGRLEHEIGRLNERRTTRLAHVS